MAFVIGLIVNPIAGIGGPAGLKGSDGMVVEASERGYEATAPVKAGRFLERLRMRLRSTPGSGTSRLRIRAAPGVMGADAAQTAGFRVATLGPDTGLADPYATDPGDTATAAAAAVDSGVDLIVFIGGDGTATDIMQTVGTRLPVLGVPAGVKMFSECFAETPEAAADLVAELLTNHGSGALPTQPAEVLDLDEDAYREGRMEVRHKGSVQVPRSPRIQSAKCPACPQDGLDEVVGEVLLRLAERPETLCIIGAGSTTSALKRRLGIERTLIGIDAARVGIAIDPTSGEARSVMDEGSQVGLQVRQVAGDADAHTLDRLVDEAAAAEVPVVVIVSPIGGQGFIIGRGTGPLTPKTIRAALPDDLWVLATAGKLETIDGALHVDTGDPQLDQAFPRHQRVIMGVGRERVLRVAHEGV